MLDEISQYSHLKLNSLLHLKEIQLITQCIFYEVFVTAFAREFVTGLEITCWVAINITASISNIAILSDKHTNSSTLPARCLILICKSSATDIVSWKVSLRHLKGRRVLYYRTGIYLTGYLECYSKNLQCNA